MPTNETLERFIAQVEQNAHVEAVEAFYTADATMQENQSAPRVGRDAHVANERRVLAKAKAVTSQCVRPVFVSGDKVVVRYKVKPERVEENRGLIERVFAELGAVAPQGIRYASFQLEDCESKSSVCTSVSVNPSAVGQRREM